MCGRVRVHACLCVQIWEPAEVPEQPGAARPSSHPAIPVSSTIMTTHVHLPGCGGAGVQDQEARHGGETPRATHSASANSTAAPPTTPSCAQAVVELGRKIRERGVKAIKFPLRKLVVVHPDTTFLDDIKGGPGVQGGAILLCFASLSFLDDFKGGTRTPHSWTISRVGLACKGGPFCSVLPPCASPSEESTV